MTEGPSVAGRHFLVGCPRSGTTLLQSMLSAHPRVWSPPETHFFIRLQQATDGPPLRRRLRVASAERAAKAVCGAPRRLPWPHGARPAGRSFVRMMDEQAVKHGRDLWLEKTPDHVHAIPLIRSVVPDARFIHLVRDGRAVVASLLEVTRAHPDIWHGAWPLDQCVDAWNSAVAATRRWAGAPGHIVVRYERLLAEPVAQLQRLAAHLELDYSPQMLSDRTASAARIVLPDEAWKVNVTDNLADPGLTKFDLLLSEAEQAHVTSRLDDASDVLAHA